MADGNDETGQIGKLGMDGLGDMPDMEVPDFLKLDEALVIDLEVILVDAPQLKPKKMMTRSSMGPEPGSNTSRDGEKVVNLRLVADSEEQHAAWMVALLWLQGGCEGPAPRTDLRMYPGGIPPRPLDDFEWSKIKANIGC